MSVNSTFDLDSVGGGYGGGLGNGSLPLWLLIFLGLGGKNGGLFGGNDNDGAAGVLAGQTQAKLDCLSQGHEMITQQITNAEQFERFTNIQDNIDRQAQGIRDIQLTVADRINDIERNLDNCCCELRVGQQETRNAIAMQTNELNVNANNNTQRVLDAINQQNITALQNDNDQLRAQLNRRETVADIISACGCCAGSNGPGNSGNNRS